MIYYNKQEDKYYYEGRSMTRTLDDGSLWSGVPTIKELTDWGFEPYVHPTDDEIRELRMQEILNELASMDYLTSKYVDGEDMSEYGDWQSKRKALREEYRQLESEVEDV